MEAAINAPTAAKPQAAPDQASDIAAEIGERGMVLTTGVPGETSRRGFYLRQNYQNPFHASTTDTFSVPARNLVDIVAFHLLDRRMMTLVHTEVGLRKRVIRFDASSVSAGVYSTL